MPSHAGTSITASDHNATAAEPSDVKITPETLPNEDDVQSVPSEDTGALAQAHENEDTVNMCWLSHESPCTFDMEVRHRVPSTTLHDMIQERIKQGQLPEDFTPSKYYDPDSDDSDEDLEPLTTRSKTWSPAVFWVDI